MRVTAQPVQGVDPAIHPFGGDDLLDAPAELLAQLLVRLALASGSSQLIDLGQAYIRVGHLWPAGPDRGRTLTTGDIERPVPAFEGAAVLFKIPSGGEGAEGDGDNVHERRVHIAAADPLDLA